MVWSRQHLSAGKPFSSSLSQSLHDSHSLSWEFRECFGNKGLQGDTPVIRGGLGSWVRFGCWLNYCFEPSIWDNSILEAIVKQDEQKM